MEKICIKCNFIGNKEQFIGNICKNCKKKYFKRYKELNKDKIKAYNEKNKEKIKEYSKNYREKNKKIISENKKIYNKKNEEKIKEKKKKYNQDNKDKLKEKRKEYYKNNKNIVNNHKLLKYFGITLNEYNKMFKIQNGKCAICGRHQNECSRAFAVDHIHINGYENFSIQEKRKYIRGLLCLSCNTALGKLQDDPRILQSAINYLLSYQ